ncbi:MAG: hypothetical protein WD009_08320 [Phycisphaeraceae bacterium]
MPGFRLTQGAFYLSTGIWLGALIMLVIAAVATFDTVRVHEPILQAAPYNAPELADRGDAILAGAIVGRVLRGLMAVQLLCAATACAALAIEHARYGDQLVAGGRNPASRLRAGLVLVPTLIIALNLAWIGPTVWEQRSVMYDVSAAAEDRHRARVAFDRYHALSERTHGVAGLLLAGAILIAPFAVRRPGPTDHGSPA